MEKVKLSDFEVMVLNEEERTDSINLIRNLVSDRVNKFKFIPLPYKNGMTDGYQFFITAQSFETEIHNFPLPENLSLTQDYLTMMDKLIEIEPNFFENYFLKGKIRLHALRNREDAVIFNRRDLEKSLELKGLKSDIFEEYKPMRQDFRKALGLLEEEIKKDNRLAFYKTKIEGELAISYKKEVFFRARSSPKFKDFFEYNLMDDAVILARASIKINRRILNENVFSDMIEAGKTLYNLANSMKLFNGNNGGNYKTGLRYCYDSRKVLGALPEVEEAIRYYEAALKEMSNEIN